MADKTYIIAFDCHLKVASGLTEAPAAAPLPLQPIHLHLPGFSKGLYLEANTSAYLHGDEKGTFRNRFNL